MPLRTDVRARLGRIAEAAATPLVPRDYLDHLAPLAGSALRGRVVEVRPETAEAVTLVIKPGRGWRRHTPGQYVRLGVDVDGVRLWRAYSLTSRVGDPHLAVTVKAIPDGVVSNHLVTYARPGLVVQLDQAAGDFVLPAEPPRKILFVTAGSGITPVMGIVRNQLDALADVVHVHAAPTAAAAIFGADLRALHASGAITLVEHHDDEHGLLTTDRLVDLVPDLAERETWACGPTGLLDALDQLYTEKGIEEQLHTERFRATILVAGDGGSLTFARQGIEVDAGGDTPILTAGEEAGALMPSGCRMGICFGCVVPLREGAVRDLRTGELTTAVEGDGVLIQTCINAAAGPCHLDV